ncbi:MAG: DUF1361 domain-containing protein [Tepidisphaeraceae bacterium]
MAAWRCTACCSDAQALGVVHRMLRESIGEVRAWATIVLVCFLCGFGVYLGRFPRLNSWDVLADPFSVVAVVSDRILNPFEHSRTWLVTLVMGGLQLGSYATLQGMAMASRANGNARTIEES